MPIYLVRWPDLSASLVQAEGEEHLLDILDQVGNPDDCEWSIYEGPLFIDFRLPVEWNIQDDRHTTSIGPQQAVIGDVRSIVTGNIVQAMQLCLAGGDDGYETGAEVLRLAFPKLHAAMERFYDGKPLDGEEAVPEAELRRILRAELERFFQGTWRRAQLGKKTDTISKLARDMDLPVQLARKYAEMAVNSGKSKYYDAALGNFELARKCYSKAGLSTEWEPRSAQLSGLQTFEFVIPRSNLCSGPRK